MDAPTLVLFLIKATIVLLGGAALAASLRRAPAGLRHVVWVATLSGVVVLPALLRLAPAPPLEVLPARMLTLPLLAEAPAPPVTRPAEAHAVTATPAVADTTVARAESPAGAPARSSFARPGLAQALIGIWALGAVGLIGWLGLAALSAARIVRRARPLDDPEWQAALCDVADRLDLPTLPRLVESARVEIPFTHGALRSTVVLPATARAWDDERRRLVLVHELAHVKRRDLLGHTLARLATALYWFHPLVWVASRRLRAESERACDDLVLACGARASDYAGHLLDIVAAARRQGAPATALPMARRREFEGRVLAILDPAVRRVGPGRLQTLAMLAGLAVIYVGVAAVAPSRIIIADGLADSAYASERGRPLLAPRASLAPRTSRVRALDSQTAPEASARDEGERERERETDKDRGGEDERPREAVSPERRALLFKLLASDPDAGVRRSAAWALGQRGQADAAAPLAAALRTDQDHEVREMAAWALAEVRGDEATAALGEALRKDESAEVRTTAGWAFGQRRHADVAALTTAASDSSPRVRQVAIWALGNNDLETAPPAVVNALHDADTEVRLTAAWALGEFRDPATAPALRKAFDEEKNEEVRRALFRALAFLGDRSSAFIDKALASKDSEIRSRAVQVAAGNGPGIWPWPWPWPQPRPFP